MNDETKQQYMYRFAKGLITSKQLPSDAPRAIFYEVVVGLTVASFVADAVNKNICYERLVGGIVGTMQTIKPAVDKLLDEVYENKSRAELQ